MACRECGGEGRIECPHCGGSGYEPLGSGDLSLAGWIEDALEAVETLVFGPEKCHECHGEGKIDCPRCGGAG